MKNLGAERVVLARELSIAEMKKIREEADVELEAFIHGALCYSFSGQCLFSSVLGGRSGNRGRCAQPCRLPYAVLDEQKLGIAPELREELREMIKGMLECDPRKRLSMEEVYSVLERIDMEEEMELEPEAESEPEKEPELSSFDEDSMKDWFFSPGDL